MFRTGAIRALLSASLIGVLAGCGGGGNDTTAESVAPLSSTSTTASNGGPTSTETTPDPVSLAAWQEIELTDAGGDVFTFADLLGRPVFLENFATWCGNCRRQLGDTDAAAEQAGDDAVFVALSVETELGPDDMAEYAQEQGFDHIRFAVMSPEMLAAINDAFGNSALNPPSTPHVAVEPDGSVGEMVTGFASPESILASLGLA